MPLEPLPCDRKEFFVKDWNHERVAGSDDVAGAGGVGGGSCSTSRWREPYHAPRDFPRASPRRPYQGQYRHGSGYQQLYPEESNGHGCTPSRSGDRIWPEDEIFRPSSGRGCGSGGSNSVGREGRGAYRRFSSLDLDGGCSQPFDLLSVTAQRSVVVPITHASSTSSCQTTPLKVHNNSSGCVIDDAGTGQRYDGDRSLGSIAWKPLKWTRASILPSSKAVRSDPDEAGLEISVLDVKESPLRSPVASPLPSDDGAPRKKPRLGWGQGLAKYEKQKVERSADVCVQNGSVQSTNNAKDFVGDTNPKITGHTGSMSPATPTSATYSSPAVTDEKLSVKGSSADANRARCSYSYGVGHNNSQVEFSINLDKLDASSTYTLASLLTDLMQLEDAFSGDSSFTRHSTAHKLLLLKNDISKELEKTESDIDLFENELKVILCDEQSNSQECSFTSQVVGVAEPSIKLVDASKALSELSFSNNCVPAHLLEEHTAEVKDTNHNSSGNVSADLELTCLERKDTDSNHLQSDACLLNRDCGKPQSSVAQPLIQSAAGMPTDLCSHEVGYCLDLITKEKSYDNSVALIISSNRGAAKRASHEFELTMPSGLSHLKIWESVDFLQCRKYYTLIKERLAMNKRLLKFKELVLALKFRALHHLWREDLRVLTIRRCRPKSNKRFELNSRSLQTAFQRHRSSIRSRFAVPGTALVPTTEILNYTSKLLLDSQIRLYRNNLKMPAQIIDEKDWRYSRFNSNNGFIEDPPAFEKERVTMNPWTLEEKELFLEMLATYGKDFKKISTFLNHKTTADSIEFYYKNHKSDSFTHVRRLLKQRNQWRSLHNNAYLITSGARNHKANVASLDLLGAASIIAAKSSMDTIVNQKHSSCFGNHDARVFCGINGPLEKASDVEVSGNERETVAADVLAGICGALSSEAMGSCVTSSIDPAEKIHFAAIDRSQTPEATQAIDEEDTCSDEGSEEVESADWADEEKSKFIEALNMYGKDFLRVSHFVTTRSRDQCKIFFSKARKCLGLDAIQPGSANVGTPVSDANGGRSDTDDGCAAEIDSEMCSTQSCSKMDVDFTQSMLNNCSEGHVHADITMQTDADESCVRHEIGGAITDEFGGKLDERASIANENGLVNKGENPKLGKDQVEIVSSCLGSIKPEHFHTELQLHTTAGVPRNASSRSFTVDELKGEVDTQLDPDGESGSPVMMEESGNVGESFCFAPNSQSNGTSCNVAELKNDDCPSVVSSASLKHQGPLELLQSLRKSPLTTIVKSEPGPFSSPNSVSPMSSSICFDEADKVSFLNNLKVQGIHWRHDSVGGDYEQQHLRKNPLLHQVDRSLHMLKGYPLWTLSQNQREVINRNIIDEKAASENPMMENITCQSDCSLLELNNHKCTSVGLLDSKPASPLPPRSELKSDTLLAEDKSNPFQTAYFHGGSWVELEDRSQGIGDLKLFGHILTHPFSQKPFSSQEGDIMPESPRQNTCATITSSSWKDESMVMYGPGSNGVLRQQGELPQRSYGFWDGNMIRTGFSSLPESAIMLAKYQGSSNGRPFCMVKDGVATSNAIITDYQQHAHVQSVSSDAKLLETFPELQKRNGFDGGVSGFQQQGRMVHLGVNVVGGGGIMVGGAGLSNPVAALQMHFSGIRANMVAGDLESRMGDSGSR